MGICTGRGVNGSSVGIRRKKSKRIDATIYGGWPKHTYFYLYILSSKDFINKPRGSHQWVSLKAVKPEKIEKLKVKDYLYLIRKATKIEKEKWRKLVNKK